MSAKARRCPTCKGLNPIGIDFCPACGTNLAVVDPVVVPWAMTRSFPPLADVVRDGVTLPHRRHPDVGGAGFVWVGFLVACGALVLDLSVRTQVGLTLAGFVAMFLGLFQLRQDHHSISRAGIFVNGAALLTLAAIAWRILDAPSATVPPPPTATPSPTPNVEVAISPEAAPQSVLMYRGGPEHTGEFPGPVPESPLYRLWRFDSGGELYSSPAIAQNRLFIGSKSGFLYALDATTGDELWSVDLGQYIVRSTPALWRDRVYVTDGYELIALDAASGQEVWTKSISFSGTTSPTIWGNSIFVAGQLGGVYAFDVETGEQRWHIQVNGLVFASPTVTDGHVYVANDKGEVVSIDPKNGQIHWRFTAEGGIFAPIAVAKERVYFSTNDGITYSLEPENGHLLWSFAGGGSSGVAIAGDIVIVGGDAGGVSAIDAGSGQPLWLVPTGSTIRSAPAVVGSTAIIASGRTVYAIDLSEGAERWTFGVGYAIETSPVVLNGLVYVGGRDGFLDAITGDA